MDSRSTTMLEIAIAMADTDGITAVTLGSVAHRARLPLEAARRDFGSRDRLVAMMVQVVLTRRPGPRRGTEAPVETLIRLAEDEWTAYRAHPWLVRVLASTRPPLVPAVLDAAHAAVEAFMELDLDSDAALNRYLSFSAYLQGMGLLIIAEREETVRSGTSYRHWWTREAGRLERAGARHRYPWLAELTDKAPAEAFDPDALFRDGLHRVIQGLTALP